MRKRITAAVAVALVATGGTASADTGTQQRTIATVGAGETTVARTAGQATVDAAYRTALSQAIDQARAKAESIAQKIGATLAREQTVTEGDGFVDCAGDAQSVSGVGQQKSSSPADSAAPAGARRTVACDSRRSPRPSKAQGETPQTSSQASTPGRDEHVHDQRKRNRDLRDRVTESPHFGRVLTPRLEPRQSKHPALGR